MENRLLFFIFTKSFFWNKPYPTFVNKPFNTWSGSFSSKEWSLPTCSSSVGKAVKSVVSEAIFYLIFGIIWQQKEAQERSNMH